MNDNITNYLTKVVWKMEEKNELLLNFRSHVQEFYDTYSIVIVNGDYKVKKMTHINDHFSVGVYYFYSLEPTLNLVKHLYKFKEGTYKLNCADEINMERIVTLEIMKELNVSQKKFVVGEKNYRICKKRMQLYPYYDLDDELLTAIYFNNEEDCVKVLNILKERILL